MGEETLRDRTYKEISDGEYLDNSQYMVVAEIFLHVIFASIFLGIKCGYHLWLFGTFSSIFLPFFIPNLSKRPKKQIGVYPL